MGTRDAWGRTGLPCSALAVGLAVALLTAPASPGRVSGTLAAVLLVGTSERALSGLVGAIAAGAVVLGGVAWLVASQTALVPIDATVAAGLGIAVGGGLGSVAWLLLHGDAAEDSSETVTVDMGGDEGAVPSPTPADLFDANPDPILYYGGDPPVVRAANPAFESVFGVSGAALDGTPLREGLFVAEDADRIATAAADGEGFDRVLACETEAERRRMRVRLAAAGGDRPAGYVLYTPVEDAA